MNRHEAIPMADLAAETAAIRDEIDTAIARVLDEGQFIGGPQVEAFEAEVADRLGGGHAIGVNSGTDALIVALRSLELCQGDEVITTPLSFVASASAILHAGATPVFADIDPSTFNLDLAALEAKMTQRTRAVVLVHLYGRPAEVDRVASLCARHGVVLVEDVAQAFGARRGGHEVGGFGDFACLSFFPSKNLGGLGDGGLVFTRDPERAEAVRRLRAHGARHKYVNEVLGYNSRLDALQAAILRVKLRHLDDALERRREAAARYDRHLASVDGIETPAPAPSSDLHTYHQYTVRIVERDAVQAELQAAGISTAIYYPVPLHQTPLFAPLATDPLPHAEQASREVLSLPIWPSITAKQQQRVIEALIAAVTNA